MLCPSNRVHSHRRALRGGKYAISVRASSWLDVCESCHPHRKQITATEQQSTYMHTHKALSQKKETAMPPLVSLYLRPGCSLFKIIARCSQSTMDAGRGIGGRDFKSKHRAYVGQICASATWRRKK